jgi:hypothetical protein
MFSIFRKTKPAVRAARRVNLKVEQFERRDLMAAPVVFSSISESIPFLGPIDFADAPTAVNKVLPTVAVSPVMESRISGRLTTGADVDVVKVPLLQGQILTADADFSAFGGRLVNTVTPKLTLFNSAGQAIVSGPTLGYRITESGTYYVGIGATGKLMDYGADYTVHLRPVGLASANLDPSWLQRTEGGMYAWLDGNTLNISGPVGHGFGIRGNWQQVVTGTPGNLTSQYETYDNLVYVQTPIGAEIPLYLDNYGMQIRTKAGKFGDLYGEITSSAIWATSEIFHGIAAKFGDTTPFGMRLTASNMPFTLGEIGLKLGNDPLLQATGAPLNAAVPYLFINGTAGLNGDFAGLHYSFGHVMLDPGDPMLYVGSDYYGYGVGLSYHGLIPFTPEKAPSQYQKSLFGHVYASGTFDLTKITGVPLNISGDVVLNLNANHTQLISAPSVSISTAMGSLQASASAVVDSEWWKNFSLGINASLNVSIPLGTSQWGTAGKNALTEGGHTILASAMSWLPDDFDLSLATASLIYDGPETALYLRGGTNNLLEGTPLEFLSSANTMVDIDAAFKEGGELFLDAKGQYALVGMPVQGRFLAARDYDLPPALAALITGQTQSGSAPVNTTGAYIEVGANVLGSGVTLKGRVQSNGDFQLTGTAGVNLGMADASVTVQFTNHNTGVSFTATLTGTITMADTVRAKVTVNFKLGADTNGNIRYSASTSSTARIQVKTPHFSTKGVTYSWDDVASVGIGISNEAFWFSAQGYNVRINLPH